MSLTPARTRGAVLLDQVKNAASTMRIGRAKVMWASVSFCVVGIGFLSYRAVQRLGLAVSLGHLVVAVSVVVMAACCLRLMRSAKRAQEESDVDRVRRLWLRDIYTFLLQFLAAGTGAFVSTKVLPEENVGPAIFLGLLQVSSMTLWYWTHGRTVVEPKLKAEQRRGRQPSAGSDVHGPGG